MRAAALAWTCTLTTCIHASHLLRRYGKAIERARDLDATDQEIGRGRAASVTFTRLVNNVMLRRTNEVIAQYLPAKLDVIVFCHLTEAQKAIYHQICAEGRVALKTAGSDKKTSMSSSLKTLSSLKRVINDPEVAIAEQLAKESGQGFDEKQADAIKARRAPAESVRSSGKLALLLALLLEVSRTNGCRVRHPPC